MWNRVWPALHCVAVQSITPFITIVATNCCEFKALEIQQCFSSQSKCLKIIFKTLHFYFCINLIIFLANQCWIQLKMMKSPNSGFNKREICFSRLCRNLETVSPGLGGQFHTGIRDPGVFSLSSVVSLAGGFYSVTACGHHFLCSL